MTIWLEFPTRRLARIRAAFSGEKVRGRDNPNQDERLQDSPQIDATGLRMLIGSSRLTRIKARRLGNAFPWLKIHTTFPADWQYPADEP